MKHFLVVFYAFAIFWIGTGDLTGDGSAPLHPKVLLELKRLEECYHILDVAAERIWPGWTNYRDVPLLFEFENGLRLLIGHPNPPQVFTRLEKISVSRNAVWADTENLRPMDWQQPLEAGGGIITYGSSQGRGVSVIHMRFKRKYHRKPQSQGRFKSERRILALIHELFHGFQIEGLKVPAGNLNFNPDAHFAVYSEIEGKALLKAFREKEVDRVTDAIKDFLLAREIKRHNLSALLRRHESADDLREGTAVFAEMRTLEILRQGFEPALKPGQDPYYEEFSDIEALTNEYLARLQRSSHEVYDSRIKCYDYGCFQALLLRRMDPDWQRPFRDGSRLLDEELGKQLPFSEGEKNDREKKWQERYNVSVIRARAEQAISDRDAAYRNILNREGRTIIISFKELNEFIEIQIEPNRQSYPLGLSRVFPGGLGTIQMDDVEIVSGNAPALIDQLYYIKFVDTKWLAGNLGLDLRFESEKGEDIFLNAFIKHPLFSLRAPRIRFREKGDRVKIWILPHLVRKEGG